MQIRNADIVVSAAGRAGLVKGHWIRPGAVVVDIAVNAVGETPTRRWREGVQVGNCASRRAADGRKGPENDLTKSTKYDLISGIVQL